MTEKEVMRYFNKFFASPAIFGDPKRLFSQDCLTVEVIDCKPVWVRFSSQETGMVGISI